RAASGCRTIRAGGGGVHARKRGPSWWRQQVISAVHHNGAAPLSLLVLAAAESWGCPPWEIAGGYTKTWFHRWTYWKGQISRKHQEDLDKLKDLSAGRGR